jgi:hypothetical protein
LTKLLVTPSAAPDELGAVPRRARVGTGSAFAAVATARDVAVSSIEVRRAVPATPRRERPVATWNFLAGDQPGAGPGFRRVMAAGRAVAVPDCWSRRDPGLADYRGPVYYAAEVMPGPGRARLVFDRLDYIARVKVNVAPTVIHEGGFTPVAVELEGGRSNRVLVRLDDPVEDVLVEPDPLMKPKRKIKGVQEEHDSRPGGLPWGRAFTPQWGLRWGSGGMAGDARLHESGDLRLAAVFATPIGGRLHVSWVIENLGAEGVAELSARIAPAGEDPGSEIVAGARVRRGASRVSVVLDVSGAEPWSPEHPALYRLHAEARTGDGAWSDSQDIEFGFREIEMPLTGDRGFQLSLNGRRTYVRAANYIPGMWPSEWTASQVRRDVELARAANLNSFGVHANVCVPVVEEADRLGLLIYQDFPLQWAYDPDRGPLVSGGSSFADASLALAVEMEYMLHNHPSVVYWCGHNEPAYQLGELFGDLTRFPEVTGFFRDIVDAPNEEPLDRRRARLLRRVDPTRPTNHCSGLGATRADGDVHDYSGSLGGGLRGRPTSPPRSGPRAHVATGRRPARRWQPTGMSRPTCSGFRTRSRGSLIATPTSRRGALQGSCGPAGMPRLPPSSAVLAGSAGARDSAITSSWTTSVTRARAWSTATGPPGPVTGGWPPPTARSSPWRHGPRPGASTRGPWWNCQFE